jgi:metal-responsive CopG/Arc/MetJ family transcriptional regulator
MGIRVEQRQRRTFTLSPYVVGWIDSKSKEHKVSRSELVNRVLRRYLQREKEREMEEGYKASRGVLKDAARATSSLRKKVIPDY